jgi:lipase
VPKTTAAESGRRTTGAPPKSEPFQAYFEVPVAGGAMLVARAGPPPSEAHGVALVLHGMSGTHMAYRTLAREVCGGARPMCVLAPDMRGRGASAELPEPYGIAAHVADLLAVLDHAGVDRAIVVGHSMGCNIAARFAADHPERTSAVVLLDGGLPLRTDFDMSDSPEEPHGLFDRFDMTFASAEEGLVYWRGHPALKDVWDEDIETFARRDFVEDEHGAHSVMKPKAALTDIRDVMLDGRTWEAITHVSMPVRLMRAERGMYDDGPLIELSALDAFLRDNPHVTAELVPDVNHFTLMMGGGHGPHRVAAALFELAALSSGGEG